MDTIKIKGFLLAVKEKSLSKAAEKFSYTPSAFSHMMDSLENELNIKLLKRTHTGIELTENGKKLYNIFLKIIDNEKLLISTANRLNEEENSVLRIGTYSSISENMLPDILKHYKNYNPNVKISIVVANSFFDWQEKNNVDIVFSDLPDSESYDRFTIMNDPFVAIVSTELFSNRKCLKKEELYDYSFIAVQDKFLNSYFDYDKFKEIIYIKSTDNSTALSMVKSNIGITLLPSLAVKSHLQGIKVLPVKPTIYRSLGFVCNKNPKSIVKNFIDFLKTNYL